MIRRALFSGLLLAVLLAALAAPAVALPQAYLVEPAFGLTGIATADLIPITFWDLTFREMVIIGALALSPVFVFPVEIFFALKLLTCFGFKRIARNNILTSTIRNTLYSLIRSRPGISFVELSQELGISRGALTYHLTLMRISQKIILLKDHGVISYFENSGRYGDGEQKVLKYLRQETDKKILLTLAKNPLMSRTDFEKLLGVSGPSVSWHMKRLIDDGILNVRKDGRFSRYILSDRTLSALMKCCDDVSGLPGPSSVVISSVYHPAIAGIAEQ
ncbi:MAG: winged helix-turn-helix transcriptional regulator [Methanoregula sp.]|nr:winged helix-turn-helix transcriptional regulator [Methanoregula sp.]